MSIYIATLTSLIVQSYFNKFQCFYQIGNVDIITTASNISITSTSVINALQNDLFEQIKCEGFVISSDQSNIDVEKIENKLRYNQVYDFNTRFYLLVHNGRNNQTTNATTFFESKVFESIVNVLLLMEQDGCVHFYTHNYKGKSPLATILIGKLCDSYNISSMDLYPNKQDDLMGRELIVSTFNFIPYVNLEKGRGAELSLMNTFIAKYNYTRKLLISTGFWGEVFDNFTGSGAKYDIFTKQADVGVAGFFISELDYKLDSSTFVLRTGLTFLVPLPKISNGLTTLLKPFHFVVWLMLLGILIALVVTLKVLNNTTNTTYSSSRYRGQSLTFELGFIILGCLLQQPMNLRMKLFGCVIINFGMLLLVIFYNSGYSSIMTKPSYLPHVSIGMELEKSDLPFYVIHESYFNSVDKLLYPNIKNNPVMVDADELKQILSKTTHASIAIDHLNIGYALGDYDEAIDITTLESFTVLKDDVAFDWCVFPVTKHSVILPVLNKFIAQLREAGLDYYYLAESFRDLNYEKSAYIRNIHNGHALTTTQFFNIRTLSGAFLIWLFGIMVSLLIFLCEIKKKFCR